jgi:Gram-negative bacterial TonB protein C-terminal
MMRLWVESYAKSTRPSSSALFSLITHAALVGAAVWATQRPPALPSEWIENRPYFLPPPDRSPSQEGSRETLKYIELAPIGLGAGFGLAATKADKPATPEPSMPDLGDLGKDLTTSTLQPSLIGGDSVYSELQVDSSVARYPGSAAPAYPSNLLKQGVQGSVTTQYVVDTTGFADTTSLKILRSTHNDFTVAVRAALPMMRFVPAKVGSRHVRQLVEQEFSFKIEPPVPAPTTKSAGARKPDEHQDSARLRPPDFTIVPLPITRG